MADPAFRPTNVTPGAYLARRRAAAGLTPADVDAALGWQPGTMEALELGLTTWSPETDAQLYGAFPYSEVVWRRLASRDPVRICHACGCSDTDACIDDVHGACHWVAPDLCSDCERKGVVR